jgi:hypothetical protein
MKLNKEREVIKSLKKEEKTLSEIANYIQANYYVAKDIVTALLDRGEIEMFKFRNKRYYKLKEVKK